ncbi:hypothetical protein [Fontimonas thermophila]|nr:hypothetical protein [Fontimonas thermophila]
MPPGPWAVQGLLKAEGLSEVSGLACSRRHPGLFWVHNDSGHRPELYAFDSRGRLRGRVRVEADLEDWEDLASFDWHGVPMLALADTGDNLAWRREVRVWLVEEPQVDQSSVRPRKVLRFTYPDGPRDVEALMVDVENGQLLLFEKRPPPARLYALALEGPEQQVARIVGELPAVPPSPAVPAETLSAWYYRDTVTAMDFDPIHRALYVLTYHRVLRFRTGPQRPWADVLQQAPDAVVPLPRDKRLYEALAVDAQGHLWATSEGADPPLMRLRE